MKTKIGLPFGLALVVFIGIFTTMLALGVLSPERADAAAMAGSVKLSVSDTAMGSTPQTVTVEFENGTNAVTATDGATEIALVFTGIQRDTVNTSEEAVNEASNWMVTITYTDDNGVEQKWSGNPDSVDGDTSTVNIELQEADDAVTPAVEAVNIPINAKVKLVFTSDDSGTVPDGFTIGGDEGTGLDVTVNAGDDTTSPLPGVAADDQPTVTDGSNSVMNLRVTSSSMTPGARARYTFRFQISDQDLVANQDEITLYFDKDFGGLDELSRNDVTVSRITAADSTGATGAFSPSSDPSRELLAVTKHEIIAKDSLNNVEYTFRAPDMNGDVDGAVNIVGESVVTVVMSSGAGITMPTEAGSKGPIGAFTNKQTDLVQRKAPSI